MNRRKVLVAAGIFVATTAAEALASQKGVIVPPKELCPKPGHSPKPPKSPKPPVCDSLPTEGWGVTYTDDNGVVTLGTFYYGDPEAAQAAAIADAKAKRDAGRWAIFDKQSAVEV